MVDVARAFAGNPDRAAATASRQPMLCFVQATDFGSLQAYERLCAEGLFAPAQDPLFVRGFAADPAADLFVATVSRDGRPLLALPLEVAKSGPFTIARFVGDRHANGNFPAVTKSCALQDEGEIFAALKRAIASARPDIDALLLERQAASLGGVRNPLIGVNPRVSPNVALAVDLTGGFDALLERSSGKRKRKKHRSQTRKFEAAGGFRRIAADTPDEVDRILDAFFAMKSLRFAKMGVADVFAPEPVRNAIRAMFKASLGRERPPFFLNALEVAGKIRGVTGSSRCRERIVCEFGAILEDELAHASPGDFLFFENIRDACAEGALVYDFSVGDEPYKRLWCDIETMQHDRFMPLTLKGRALVAAVKAKAAATRRVKNSSVLWPLVKRLRKSAAPATQPSSTPDDD